MMIELEGVQISIPGPVLHEPCEDGVWFLAKSEASEMIRDALKGEGSFRHLSVGTPDRTHEVHLCFGGQVYRYFRWVEMDSTSRDIYVKGSYDDSRIQFR